MLSFGIDKTSQSFCHSFIALSMIDNAVQSQPRNPLFRCVKSLLWKPHSWF